MSSAGELAEELWRLLERLHRVPGWRELAPVQLVLAADALASRIELCPPGDAWRELEEES